MSLRTESDSLHSTEEGRMRVEKGKKKEETDGNSWASFRDVYFTVVQRQRRLFPEDKPC